MAVPTRPILREHLENAARQRESIMRDKCRMQQRQNFAILLFLLCATTGCEKLLPLEAEKPPQVQPNNVASTSKSEDKRDPNAVEKITFADLDLPLDAAPDYQSWMLTQRVHDLTDRRVQISGFMSEGLFQLQNVREFVLMRDRECCVFGPGATADHLIQVRLMNQTISYTTREITVEGRLAIKPFVGSDGKTWSVFSLDATRVTDKE